MSKATKAVTEAESEIAMLCTVTYPSVILLRSTPLRSFSSSGHRLAVVVDNATLAAGELARLLFGFNQVPPPLMTGLGGTELLLP
jgi:hypothetical protein